jgi:hypothetical protein
MSGRYVPLRDRGRFTLTNVSPELIVDTQAANALGAAAYVGMVPAVIATRKMSEPTATASRPRGCVQSAF